MENSVQCFQVKFNEFIPNEPIENECDFVKQTTENNYKTYVDAITQSRIEFHSQNSVHEKKKEITIWKKMLNERKQAYWNAIRCENLADVYEKWRQNKDVILPRKFRPKPIDNEPEEETRIRGNLAIQKFDAEISLLRLRVPKYRAKYTNHDQVMHDEIANISGDDIQIKLRGLWEQKTNQDKIKSDDLLRSKQKWLEDYANNYGNAMMKSPDRRKRRKNNHHRQKPNINSRQQNENNNQNPHSRREIPLPRQKQWENKEIRPNNHSENNDIQRKDEYQTRNNTRDDNWRKPDHSNQPEQNTYNNRNQRKTN